MCVCITCRARWTQPWALHREAGMCDEELHRGKYVCVHDVPCALHLEAGMCDQEGSRHV